VRGLLWAQVHNAYKHLVKYSATYANPAVHFNVDLPLHHGGSRGVYLRYILCSVAAPRPLTVLLRSSRNWEETQQVLEATVRITPVFHDAVSSEVRLRVVFCVSHDHTYAATTNNNNNNNRKKFDSNVDTSWSPPILIG